MNSVRRYLSKLFFKQWTIGVANVNIQDVIRNKTEVLDFKWLKPVDKMQSYADPCAYINYKNELVIFAEDFTTGKLNGKISVVTLNDKLEFSDCKPLIQDGIHFSYPVLYEMEDALYVLVENALDGGLHAYELDKTNNAIIKKHKISNLPLVDATILKKENKYWLFASKMGKGVFSDLYIFCADNFFGPYTAHQCNPVKSNLNGTRPGGRFIEVDGEIFRPSQNCMNFYGESITIQKVKKLSLTAFEEEVYMQLKPKFDAEFNLGIHTVNGAGNFVVADGQKGHFQPIRQFIRFLARVFSKNLSKLSISACYLGDVFLELFNPDTAATLYCQW